MSLSPKRAPQTTIPLWVSVSGIALLAVGGGVMIWAGREDVPQANPTRADVTRTDMRQGHDIFATESDGMKILPPRPGHGHGLTALHSFSYGEENGVKVVRLRLVADGDEVVLDATTGRLIESRPFRPQAKSPAPRLAPADQAPPAPSSGMG